MASGCMWMWLCYHNCIISSIDSTRLHFGPNWSKFEEAAAPRLKCQESKCTYHAFQQRPSPATLAMAGAAGHFDFLKKSEPKVQKMQGFIIDCLNIDTLHSNMSGLWTKTKSIKSYRFNVPKQHFQTSSSYFIILHHFISSSCSFRSFFGFFSSDGVW